MRPSSSPALHHPSDPLRDLAVHLRLFGEALANGHAQQIARRAEGLITAHAYLAHQAVVEDSKRIAAGVWGGRGVLTAYHRMAMLTPVVAMGLQGHGVAARLRDRGILDPHGVWRGPFSAMGVCVPTTHLPP